MTASRSFHLTAVFGIASGIAASAAWAQVGTPLLGFLPDSGRIRPVNGIAAAASIAPPLDFGGTQFLQIAISPRQDFALVSRLDTGAVLVASPNGTTTPVAGVSAHPDGIWLSPVGSAAVLWFGSSRLIEIVSGLPGSPVVRQVNASFLSAGSSDVPSALAVSDDGAWGAGAWGAGKSSSGVWGFGPNGEVKSLLASNRVFALAFFAGREDLAAATASGANVAIDSVTDVGGSATVATLYTASSAQTLSRSSTSISGLGISTDNRRLVMTDRTGGILTVDLTSGAASSTNCSCAPDASIPMGGSLFRITGLTGSVFRVFDASAGSVFLVPLPAADVEGDQQ
jgi:hypothetical protein